MNTIKLIKSVKSKTGGFFLKVVGDFMGKRQDIKVLSIYGISFNPPDNVLGVMLNPNGYEDDGVAIIDDPGRRFTQLQKGELKIGNYLTGASVYFKANGDIDITPGSSNTININGNISVTGTVTASDFVTSSVSSYNAHTHSGVESGPSNTGGPN